MLQAAEVGRDVLLAWALPGTGLRGSVWVDDRTVVDVARHSRSHVAGEVVKNEFETHFGRLFRVSELLIFSAEDSQDPVLVGNLRGWQSRRRG